MTDYESLVMRIAKQTGTAFRPAEPMDLAKLAELKLPASIIDFYRTFEPERYVEGPVRLWPIQELLRENTDYVPGCYTVLHGYVVFASTTGGDPYCFDTTKGANAEPRIVLFSHEMIEENTPATEIARLGKPVARNLYEFLQQFADNKVDQECRYS